MRHLNGRRDDNRLENLKWGTPGENAADRDAHGKTARGELNGRAKIDQSQALLIQRMRAVGVSFDRIAWVIDLSKRQVQRICDGTAWHELHEPITSEVIDAPREVPVHRGEIYEAIQRERKQQ